MRRQVYLWSAVFALCLVLGLALFAVPSTAKVDTGFDWPRSNGSPKRTLKYYIKGKNDSFKTDVRSAAGAWNGAKTGWKLEETTSEDEADVVIEEKDLGGANSKGSIVLGTTEIEGDKGDWKGTVKKPARIAINNNAACNWGSPTPPKRNRTRTIMHEFGHAMRLDHTHGAKDVMKQSTSTLSGTAFSAEDLKEAKSAAKFKKGGLKAKKHVRKRDVDAIVEIVPESGAESTVNLTDVTNIQIEPFFTDTLNLVPIEWTSKTILVMVHEVFSGAGHHEGITVSLTYTSGIMADFQAQLVITGTDPLSGARPHAAFVITPTGWFSGEQMIRLDAAPTFHDQITTPLTYRWQATRPGQTWFARTFDEYAAMFLLPGTYTITLLVEDTWGQVDQVSQRLQVPYQIFVPLILKTG